MFSERVGLSTIACKPYTCLILVSRVQLYYEGFVNKSIFLYVSTFQSVIWYFHQTTMSNGFKYVTTTYWATTLLSTLNYKGKTHHTPSYVRSDEPTMAKPLLKPPPRRTLSDALHPQHVTSHTYKYVILLTEIQNCWHMSPRETDISILFQIQTVI